jgi:hypothetical protein
MDDFDFELDDAVIFELPTHADVAAFCDRLRPRWEGWSDEDERVWLFSARVDANADLADLLREAQELIAELGLDTIRFYLDGRVYPLGAARSQRPADLAA